MNDAEIRLQVSLDSTGANSKIDSLNERTKKLSDSFTSAGKKLTAGLTLPIVGLGIVAVKNASDLQETMNKVDVAFGDSADEVTKWGKTTLKQYGMAKGTALDMASLFGDMATGMGVNQKEASKLAMNLTGLAGDLASFKNVSQDVAKTALAGVFTGETESLKQLGIVMTEANLQQYALSKGMTKNINDMTQAEKIQLRYAYITEVSKNAVGDFARTSDSTANQIRITTETFKELSEELGDKLRPTINVILSKIISLMNWFSNLNDKQKKTILTILGIVAAIGPLLMIIGGVLKFIQLLSIASTILNVSMLPMILTIGAIVLGITALVFAIIWVVKHLDLIKEVAGKVWEAIKGFFGGIGEWFSGVFDKVWLVVKSAFTKIGAFINSVFKGIGNAFISMGNLVIGGLNAIIKSFLAPFNLIIKGLNKLPDVNIKYLSFSIPKIPKLSIGTDMVNQEGLAYLHKGESVQPASVASGGYSNRTITLNIEMGDINMDGNKVGRAITPYVTKTVKLSGGNI